MDNLSILTTTLPNILNNSTGFNILTIPNTLPAIDSSLVGGLLAFLLIAVYVQQIRNTQPDNIRKSLADLLRKKDPQLINTFLGVCSEKGLSIEDFNKRGIAMGNTFFKAVVSLLLILLLNAVNSFYFSGTNMILLIVTYALLALSLLFSIVCANHINYLITAAYRINDIYEDLTTAFSKVHDPAKEVKEKYAKKHWWVKVGNSISNLIKWIFG
jgi:hypothetical protein